MNHAITRAALGAALCPALAAGAAEPERLVDLINAYRAAPQQCEGKRSRALPALAPHAALARVSVAPGQFLDQAVERAGYEAANVQAIEVSGADNARDVMALIGQRYCSTLLSTQFSAIGASRSGATWLLLLAEPAPPPPVSTLPGQSKTGIAILQAVNAARAAGALCGERRYASVAPLAWNNALADAALAHSGDMAAQRFLSHHGKDGRLVSERAAQAGYLWRTIGENIAVGQDSAADAVAGWLDSPGHCANIMNPAFTEMGAAYAVRGTGRTARVYWTQVFGKPR